MGGGAISKLIGEDDSKKLEFILSEEAKKDLEGKDILNSDDAINEVKRLRIILKQNYEAVQAGIEREKELMVKSNRIGYWLFKMQSNEKKI